MKVKSFLALFSEIFMLISKAFQTLPGNSLYLVYTYSGKLIQKLYLKNVGPEKKKKEWVVS